MVGQRSKIYDATCLDSPFCDKRTSSWAIGLVVDLRGKFPSDEMGSTWCSTSERSSRTFN
eukprot:1242215-Pyramimonas_sp.AAC.1